MTDHLKTPAGKVRLRGLGINLEGQPGKYNNITDVGEVEVGYTTLISGDGPLDRGQGPIRTGVTAIIPHGKAKANKSSMAGIYSLNGNGELTGSHWVEESGFLETPITITNTHSCGTTRDATAKWLVDNFGDSAQPWQLPVAGETYDGDLNDIGGCHVTFDHTFEALNSAISGPIDMGSVGGGTGMLTYDFKAGSGSASRVVTISEQNYTVGAFVQSNFGKRQHMQVDGAPVGKYMRGDELRGTGSGSIIAVIATDAPLLPHQLKRMARRVPLGLARTGCHGENGSGDIFIAFSTANSHLDAESEKLETASFLNNGTLDSLFEATVQSVEEAVLDAIVTADTMAGRDGNTAIGIDTQKMLELYQKFHLN